MNTKCLRLFAAGFIFAVFACNGPSSNTPPAQPGNADSPMTMAQILYRYDSAINDVKRYHSEFEKHYPDDSLVKAFTIHAVDLMVALGLPKGQIVTPFYKYVRVYIGMNSKHQFKLFLLPVMGADLNGFNKTIWGAGMDILLDSTGRGILPDNKKLTGEGDEYVLDLNAPCPNTCPAGGAFPPPPPIAKKK